MFFRSRDGESYRLATQAAIEASALGHRRIGPQHLLLGFLDPEHDTPASRALLAAGADHEKLRAAIVAEAPASATADSGETTEGISPTAGTYQMIGRAEGLAIGLGESRVTAEHVLLALLLYDGDGFIAYWLEQAGASREAAWRELQRQGTNAPNLALPALRGAPLPQ